MGYKATSFADTTLASNITATSTTLALATGKGDDFPTLTSADWTLVVLTDKNGNREVIRIVARSGDNLTVGTTVGAGANVSGRGYESTMALAITYTDDHSVRCAPTGALIQAMADYSDQGDLTSTTAEISTLHSSGITNADLVKVHAITATKDELNILDGITSTTAELNILDGVTADKDQINYLDTSGITNADLVKVHATTATKDEINATCDGGTARNNHLHSNIGVTGGTGITTSRADLAAALTISVTAASISQSLLKTSTGSVSATSALTVVTLPGGEYGFTPQVHTSNADFTARITEWETNSLSYVSSVSLSGYGGATAYCQQRYITSSGEVFWVFILRDKFTKKVISSWQAPDHPCMGNGGKPLLVAHPFLDFDSGSQEIIVITPAINEVNRMRDRCIVPSESEPDRDLLDVIRDEYVIVEESRPKWTDENVTVGLPFDEDWQRVPNGTIIQPIQKKIPKHECLIHKTMRRIE